MDSQQSLAHCSAFSYHNQRASFLILFSLFFMIYSHVYLTSQMIILSTNLPPFLVLSSLQISVILYMEKGFSPTLYGLYGEGFPMNEFHQL